MVSTDPTLRAVDQISELLGLLEDERRMLENRKIDALAGINARKEQLISALGALDPTVVQKSPPLRKLLRSAREENEVNGRIIARTRAANRKVLETLRGSEAPLYEANGESAAEPGARTVASA